MASKFSDHFKPCRDSLHAYLFNYYFNLFNILLVLKMREGLFAIGEVIMNCNEKVLEFGT